MQFNHIDSLSEVLILTIVLPVLCSRFTCGEIICVLECNSKTEIKRSGKGGGGEGYYLAHIHHQVILYLFSKLHPVSPCSLAMVRFPAFVLFCFFLFMGLKKRSSSECHLALHTTAVRTLAKVRLHRFG